MPFKLTPKIDPRYWAGLILASVFGANTGDFLAHDLHLGHVAGLPYLAAAFVLILLAERFATMRWEGWYWLAIVTVRTAATNLADLATHDDKFGAFQISLALLVLLVIVLLARRAIIAERDTADMPRADLGYWLAMLTAGTLGTALGDGLADERGLAVATALTAVATVLAFALRWRVLAGLAGYWLAVIAIRTFGTNLGDLSAHAIGLANSTVLSGLVLLACLSLWRSLTSTAPA